MALKWPVLSRGASDRWGWNPLRNHLAQLHAAARGVSDRAGRCRYEKNFAKDSWRSRGRGHIDYQDGSLAGYTANQVEQIMLDQRAAAQA